MPTMMQSSVFSDFNPLDVLAAAASLQSARTTDSDSETAESGGRDDGSQEDDTGDQDGDDGPTKTEGCSQDTVVPRATTSGSSMTVMGRPVSEQGLMRPPLDKTGPRSVLAQGRKPTVDGKTVLTMRDATKVVMPSPSNKALTVLRINKQMTDHSYAYVCQVQNLRSEEDEGYSSRSSIDEEGDDITRSLSAPHTPGSLASDLGSPRGSDLGSPGLTFDSLHSPTSPKAPFEPKRTKIVILSSDSLHKSSACADSKACPPGSVVLRTLLGQKPIASLATKLTHPTETPPETSASAAPADSPLSIQVEPAARPSSPPLIDLVSDTSLDEEAEHRVADDPAPAQEQAQTDSSSSRDDMPPGGASEQGSCETATTPSTPAAAGLASPDCDSVHCHEASAELVAPPAPMPAPTPPSCTQPPKDTSPTPATVDTQPAGQSIENTQDHGSSCGTHTQLRQQTSSQVSCAPEAPSVSVSTGAAPDEDQTQHKNDLQVNTQHCTLELKNTDSSETHHVTTLETEIKIPIVHVDEDSTSLTEDITSNETQSVDTESLKSEEPSGEVDVKPADLVAVGDEACAATESSTQDDESLEIIDVVSTGTDTLSTAPVDVMSPVSIVAPDALTPATTAGNVSSVAADVPVLGSNQYIIQDDVSPVTKFSEAPSASAASAAPVTATVTLSSAPGSQQSLLKGAASGGLMHIIPVVNASSGRLVTGLLPRSVQYVTAVPIPGKGVVRVTDSKLLTMPTFTPATTAQTTLPKSRTGSSKSRTPTPAVSKVLAPGLLLSSISIPESPEKVASSASGDVTESAVLDELCGLASPGGHDPMLGSPAPLPAETLTLSGSRPVTPASSTRPGTPAGDKINLQISASQIMEGSYPVDEYASARKETRSIGMLGSLSWRGVNPGLIQLGTKDNKAEFLRIQGSNIQSSVASDTLKSSAASLVSLRDPRLDSPGSSLLSPSGSRSASPWTRAPSDVQSSPEDAILEVSESASEDSNLSSPPSAMGRGYRRRLGALKKLAMGSTTELHPLIDHDYCMFTEFNAQIQSSIIATTETKVKTERKYTKKAKVPPVKVVPPPAPTRVGKVKAGKLLKGRRGRYKKKDALRIAELKKAAAAAAASEPGVELDVKLVKKEPRRPGRPEKKPSQRKKVLSKDQKNYVKIPGSYQDEFVYFATRNYRNRPRKPLEPPPDPNAKPGKIPTVQGLNVFDWYRDLSKTDKSCFGAGDQKADAGGVASTVSQAPIPDPGSTAPTATVVPGPDATPCHESEVADLVCELSEMIPDGTATTEPKKEGGKEDEMDINTMAEQVRMMLNCLGEDELQMLETLEDSTKMAASTALTDTSFDGFLAGFNAGTEPTLTQHSTSQLSCDLDEINDSDLLTTNPGDMTDLLGDLTVSRAPAAANPTPAVATTSMHLTTAAASGDGFTAPPISNMKLDKTELFPDIVAPPSIPTTTQDAAAPELTFVNMYWNDLPGLMIGGKEHVRLVDIHKQVLPAKDTGILKKRCQMMGLEISNCSELQRDFLVRYANAAKSKSTVIVSKAAAQTLIGFYVDPRPRAPRLTAEERAGSSKRQEIAKPTEVPVEVKEEAPVPTVVMKEELVDAVETSETTVVEESVPIPESKENIVIVEAVKVEPITEVPLPITLESEVVAEEPPSQTDPEPRGGKGKRKRKRTNDTAGTVDKEYSPDNARRVLRVASSHLVKRSERLKHKKVKYADMVNGLPYAEEEPEVEAEVVEEHAVVAVPVTAAELSHIEVAELEEAGFSSDHENKDWNSCYAEELRKLRAKGKRRKLNKREMGRARRLRDYIHQKEALRKLREKRKALASRHKLNGQKSRQKLLETHVYTKSMNPEHCYAACPEGFNKDSSQQQKADTTSQPVSGDTAPETRGSLLQPLAVLHRDPSQRGGQRSRTQEGVLHLQRLSTRDSHCIQCTTCQESFSVRRFLKHMHHQNNPDELLHVTLAKTLDLSNPHPTATEQQLWGEFLRRQATLLGTPPVRKDSRRDRTKDARNTPTAQQKQSLGKDTSKDTGKEIQHTHNTLTNANEELLKNMEIKTKTVAAPQQESVVKVEHSPKPLDVEIQIREHGEGSSVPGDPAGAGSSVRQSGRVRKRKQLHPIESYVFSQLSPGNSPASKRVRTDATIENINVAVSPVRAVKVKVTVKKGEQNTVTKH